MTLTIEVFPAGYGDSLLVSFGTADSPTRILIDGGLRGAASHVLSRLKELDARIDLFVITHIDADHIAGAVKLLEMDEFVKRLDAVWFNGREHLEQYNDLLGPLDGERVGGLLTKLGLPWNASWHWRTPADRDTTRFGGPIVVGGSPTPVELPGGATATLLSPDSAKLVALLPEWRAVIEKAGLVDGVAAQEDPAEPETRDDMLGELTLADLARMRTEEDTAEANGSSIAFILEVPERDKVRRVLLTGDAHPDLLTESLRTLQGGDGTVSIDICKLPHHGSCYNVSEAFVSALSCNRWIVSTNGRRFHHPNAEALARIIVAHPGSRIYANYEDNIPITQFVKTYPPAQHDYTLIEPTDNRLIVAADD
jgi:hypothetical protein